jgi:hypothetical protein
MFEYVTSSHRKRFSCELFTFEHVNYQQLVFFCSDRQAPFRRGRATCLGRTPRSKMRGDLCVFPLDTKRYDLLILY